MARLVTPAVVENAKCLRGISKITGLHTEYKMDWKQKVYYIYDVTNWRLFVELFLLVTFILNGNSLPVTDADDTSVEVISLNAGVSVLFCESEYSQS